MNDYVDLWNLNGTAVYLQDYERGQPNGVALLDASSGVLASSVKPTFIPAPVGEGSLITWITNELSGE